jgi:RNA-directed DNA polymerase
VITERIASELGLSADYVAKLARTASHRYKTYEIPKATGGTRTINHPARELKLLQSWLASQMFSLLPVHSAAFAYRKGRNILAHAAVHTRQNFLLKVDFRNFFPSITGADVEALLRRNEALFNPRLEGLDYQVVKCLVCRDDRLTIGAPSSPVLANAVMFEFDVRWHGICESGDVVYSRYADDLYFSTNLPNVLSRILSDLRLDLMNWQSPRLTVNNAKTVFTSRKRKRIVTGLVVTSDRAVSLGRDLKRSVRSLVFKHGLNGSSAEGVAHLRGLISYARSVDPAFIKSLQRKFGEDVRGLL